MFKKPLFIEMFALLILVGVLNWLATIYNLYWSIYEFDSLVHFLAGASVSLFFLWLYFYSGFFNPQEVSLKNFLLISILGAMFIAVSWEIFEFILGESLLQKVKYPFDTMMDLIMDFLGAIVGCFYGCLKEYNAKS